MKKNCNLKIYILSLILPTIFDCVICQDFSQGYLRLVDNGYEGLVISITQQVPQEHCNSVLHGLKGVLREFSSLLWVATNGRASLREATVSLPNTWQTNSVSCSLLQPVSTASPPFRGHISVTGPHPLFGNRPWTQQSQGCGRPGDFIQVGAELLRSASNDTHVYAARLLLSEWAKFRWGVFSERGFVGDALYPPFYRDPKSHQWDVTICSDEAVRTNAEGCDSKHPSCHFSLDPFANPHVSSSLLAFPELQAVRKFCDETTHNQEAPTKQNVLCEGKSAWEVIEQSTDFANGRNMESNTSRGLEPVIRYVKETNPRHVFVIEDTASMNLQRRWEFLRKAIRRVIVYDVPDKSYVAVVTFNSASRSVAPLTYIESEDSDMRQRVGASLPRNPSSVPETHKCILCGIQEAIRMLETDPLGTVGANIILVTSGAGTSTHYQMTELERIISNRKVRITPVLYPLSERPGAVSSMSTQGLEVLAQKSNEGRSFTVMDEGVGNDSKVSMLMALMEALLGAVKLSSPPDATGAPVLIHSEAYPGGISSMSSGTFALDESLGQNARFSVFYYDLNHVGNTIQLKSPSGATLSPLQEEDGDVNMIFVNLEKAERGIWTYTVENRADSHQGLYVQVTSKRNSSSGLNIRLWANSGANPVNASNLQDSVVIYAQVLDGEAPILNTRVVATLQRLGTNKTGNTYEPIRIDLWDNGIGDPDITSGDGIYSRYLPRLHGFPGRYLLSADIDYNNGLALISKSAAVTRHHKIGHSYYFQHHDTHTSNSGCCGSVILHSHTRRSPPFHRHITWGVLDVRVPHPPHDLIPPGRILDLIVDVNDTLHEVVIKWTAPGGDFDYGRADRYEALVSPSWKLARSFQGERLNGLPKPLPAGTLHTTTLQFHKYEELWYLVIRAVDYEGNVGLVGNIAALWVPRPPTTYEITTRTQPGLTTSGNYTLSSEFGSGRPLGMYDLRIEDIAAILGAIGGFLLVVILLVSYCVCHSRRRRKQQEKKDSECPSRGNGSVMIKSASCHEGIEEGLSKDSIDSVVKEEIQGTRPLSPVQSWGATTLLQEHERRLSMHSNGVNFDEKMMCQPDPLMHGIPAPYPDVTVTDYRACDVPTPSPSSNTHSTDPQYSCTPEDLQYQCAPGPDYTSYASGWDEPLTGNLLARVRTPGAVPQNSLLDRKRRNVTQV